MSEVEKLHKVYEQIDTSITNQFIEGKISEDDLFNSLSPEMQGEVINIAYSLWI